MYIIFLDKKFNSFRPKIQVDNSYAIKYEDKTKESSNIENEFLKKKVEALHKETLHLKKKSRHVSSQVKSLIY